MKGRARMKQPILNMAEQIAEAATMTNELPIANLNLTQKEADLVVAGIKMLWNARRYARIDENGDPYQVHHDVVALLEKLKGFRESAFSRN
jgi:hypothetical protein